VIELRSLKRLAEPAYGAEPVPAFPVNAAMRAGLFGVFLVYAGLGQFKSSASLAAMGLLFVAAAIVFAEFLLLRNRIDVAALLRTWSVVLPIDIAAQAVATVTECRSFSPIPFLAIPTVLTASAMFRPQYVFAITGLAIAGLAAGDATIAFTSDQNTWAHLSLVTVMLLAATVFSVDRSAAEQRLRRRLMGSEAREHEQAQSLRVALDAAHVSEARFQAFSDYAPAVLLLFDSGGRLAFASRYAGSVSGLAPEALRWGTVRSRLREDELPMLRGAVQEALGGHSSAVEFRATDEQGRVRRLSGVFFPVGDGAGAIVLDVTAERALTEQVQHAQQMETLGTLAGGIAHDFNNLLTAMLGNIFLIEQGLPADSPLRAVSEDARLAGERGAELVRRLLDYSRPPVDERGPVSLASLVAETTRLAQHGLTRQVEIEVGTISPAATVMGDFPALQQVLLNLMVNARDAMGDGGRLTISVETLEMSEADLGPGAGSAPGPYHAVRVRDTGTGIAPSVLPRIFDPFFTTKGVGKGSGLGLPTALNILRAHGGWMNVETTDGRGSTVTVLLPAVAPATELVEGVEGRVGGGPEGKPR
jgi:signal transduction histidine kinase